MSKIRVIIKRPDEKYGHVAWISNTLENLQKTVDGYIETVTIATDAAIVCNEEGKLRNLEPNMTILGEPFVGTIIFVGVKGEEFTDFPLNFEAYKALFFRPEKQYCTRCVGKVYQYEEEAV